MAAGWECPKCGLILAPSVTEHRCDPPSAGVPAAITRTGPSSGSGTSTATFPPGTTVITTNSGTVTLSASQVSSITRQVQSALLKQARMNRRYPGSAA